MATSAANRDVGEDTGLIVDIDYNEDGDDLETAVNVSTFSKVLK